MRKILVTGGSGMVGKSLQDIMPDAIYLSSSQCNLLDKAEVDYIFERHKPDTVIHLAAVVSGIEDNINRPFTHFQDNVMMNSLVLDACLKNGVRRLISMLSTCVYPDKARKYPMTEDQLHESPPTPTNFSYGYAKRCMAVAIDACNKQNGTKYQYMIPSNLYGIHDKYQDSRSHFVAALIKKIHIAKQNNEKNITLFGDGTPKRQFVLAHDVAKIIKLTLRTDITESFNICGFENLSISEIAHIALKACEAQHLGIKWDYNSPNGQINKEASNEKLKKLFPDFEFTQLYDGIKETYEQVKYSEKLK